METVSGEGGDQPPQSLADWLKETIVEVLDQDPESIVIDYDTPLGEIDSLASIEIVEVAEEKYGISVDDAELGEIKTTGDFLDLIQRKIDEQGSPS